MLDPATLQDLRRRYEELNAEMARPEVATDPKRMTELAREHRALGRVVRAIDAYESMLSEAEGLRDMAALDDEPELAEMARTELAEIEAELPRREEALRLELIPKDPEDSRNAIVEIRAGTGGDEAGLFAGDLYRMYTRYAESHGWTVEPLGSSEGAQGGFKEVTFLVKGEDAFGQIKYESGVHRVQRVPATESSGRIHTSAATVAVLPEAEDVDIEIRDEDLEIDVYRSSGPGGQSVNTTDSAVRITHKPTGLVVTCQDEKSQHKNKDKALRVLRSRLYEQERERQEAERSEARRSMVGSGDRSAKIRTYNWPQSRVTDHRLEGDDKNHGLDGVMNGDLDPIIHALRLADNARRLANLGAD